MESESHPSESSLTAAASSKSWVSVVIYSIPEMSNISVLDKRRYERKSS